MSLMPDTNVSVGADLLAVLVGVSVANARFLPPTIAFLNALTSRMLIGLPGGALLAGALSLLGPIALRAEQALPRQSSLAAPAQHPGTGLSFPSRIAGTRLTRSADYAKALYRSSHGYFWRYEAPRTLVASIYLYEGCTSKAGDDALIEPPHDEFDSSVVQIEQGSELRYRYDQVQLMKGKSECEYGGIAFRCAVFSAIDQNGAAVMTGLMLTRYQGHFVQLRLDWPRDSQEGNQALEHFLETFWDQLRRLPTSQQGKPATDPSPRAP